MYLKEAFRYQNYLQSLIDQTTTYLSDANIVMKTTQEHLRGKANPEAVNETVDMTAEREIDCDANLLIEFLVYLLKTKESLTAAIAEAKSGCGVDIDGAVANNKTRQTIALVLSRLGNRRPTERMRRGTDYKFNAEGNQVPYAYDIKEVSVIDFDRNKVKAIARRLAEEADEMSMTLDRVLVETEVGYKPLFSVNDSYEDAVEIFRMLN